MREFLIDDLVTVFGSTECAESDLISCAQAQFVRDFGPFKAGEEIESLLIDLLTGCITEYVDEKPLRTCKFRLEAIDG